MIPLENKSTEDLESEFATKGLRVVYICMSSPCILSFVLFVSGWHPNYMFKILWKKQL